MTHPGTGQKATTKLDPTVFVVDDDLSMREALRALIAANGLRVECFDSAQAFLARPASDSLACLVLDVRMPQIGGFELQRELAVSDRELPVIFITAHADIPMVVRAMKAGAAEFLAKPVGEEELLAAIHQALERDRQALERRAERARLRERRERLTQRERQVMSCMGAGMLNKQIAAQLGVSENTVKAHRRHIMSKMGAASLAQLVRMMDQF